MGLRGAGWRVGSGVGGSLPHPEDVWVPVQHRRAEGAGLLVRVCRGDSRGCLWVSAGVCGWVDGC